MYKSIAIVPNSTYSLSFISGFTF